jgi:hypothetical protein
MYRLSLLSLLLGSLCFADPALAVERTFDAQVDPTPLFLRGFAPELGVTLGRHRLMATIVQYDVPTFLAEDKAFAERRNGTFGLGYQYFFLHHLEGLFAGVMLSATSSSFRLVATGTTHDTWTWRATLRVGWVVAPFASTPAFFLAPWVGANAAFAAERFAVDGTPITRRTIGVIAALQLGYRFPF